MLLVLAGAGSAGAQDQPGQQGLAGVQQAAVHQAAAVHRAARQQVQPLLRTLQTLATIDAGVHALQGNADIAELVSRRLEAIGMRVREMPTRKDPMTDPNFRFWPRFVFHSPPFGLSIYGHKAGTGKRRILLMAHADTLNPRQRDGERSRRIGGGQAPGLRITDDLANIALAVHIVELLHALGNTEYASLGLLINGLEWPQEQNYGESLHQLGETFDVILTLDPPPRGRDAIRLEAVVAARMVLEVAAASGPQPDARPSTDQAVFELVHQIAKTRALNDESQGRAVEWNTLTTWPDPGVTGNSIAAWAMLRAWGPSGMDALQADLRAAFSQRLMPHSSVMVRFHARTPGRSLPLGSDRLARHAVQVYAGMGRDLAVETPNPPDRQAPPSAMPAGVGLLGGLGLQGSGLHPEGEDAPQAASIAARLALGAQLVMDAGSGRLEK